MNENKVTMNNLKKIVKAKNKSLVSIAVELEVSQEAISQYISGKINPKLSNVIKLSKILNTTTDYLLDLTNNPSPSNFKLTEEELNFINNYRNLNTTEQIKVEAYTQAIIDIKKD